MGIESVSLIPVTSRKKCSRRVSEKIKKMEINISKKNDLNKVEKSALKLWKNSKK